MKKLFILLVFPIVLFALTNSVQDVATVAITNASGPAGYTLFYNGLAGTTSGSWPIGDSVGDTYAGLANWSNPSPRIIGKAVVTMEKTAGSISGKTYYFKIWAQGSGNNLGTLLATVTGVAGDNTWNGVNIPFIFPTPYHTTGSTVYHLTMDADNGTSNVSNYASAYHRSDTLDTVVGNLAFWDNTGAATLVLTTFDFKVDLYTTP